MAKICVVQEEDNLLWRLLGIDVIPIEGDFSHCGLIFTSNTTYLEELKERFPKKDIIFLEKDSRFLNSILGSLDFTIEKTLGKEVLKNE